MVKGITRQVIVVKGADTKLFEQAIFLVRDDVLSKGGISEEALLAEAKQASKGSEQHLLRFQKLAWCSIGAVLVSCLWLISAFI